VVSDPAGDRERTLARAKRYPYAAARTSFALVGGRQYAVSLTDGAGGALDLARARARDPESARELPLTDLPASDLDPGSLAARVPVLAYAANRSPEALERKRSRPGFPADTAIVVLRARLRHLDVVYSAHLSAYGSVGATLQRSPGTSAEVSVTLLTEPQLAALGETEPNYTLEELRDMDVELEGGGRLDRVRSYVSRHGCLVLDRAEVALAAIPARGRRLSELTQPEVLDRVARHIGRSGALDEFILKNVADPQLAAERTRQLRRDARPLEWPLAPASAS
jgi:hypothetical protein